MSRRAALPVDALVAGYAAFAALALAFPRRPPDWAALLLLHAGIVVVALAARRARQGLARAEMPETRATGSRVTPPETRAAGSRVTPPKARATGSRVTPPKTRAAGSRVTPPKTRAAGSRVTPPKTRATGSRVTPPKTRATGSRVTPPKTPAAEGYRLTAARVLLDWYPLLLVPFFYSELDTLNRAVHGGAFFDAAIQRIEAAVFGMQPSFEWSRAWPVLAFSEVLHAGYLAYYPLIYLPPLFLYLRARRDEFRTMVFALVLTFVMHYVFFIYLPVQGPRYLFDAPTGGLERGPVYRLAHWILESGSSQGAAFPSSHVGVAVAQTLLVARFAPRLALPVATATVLLAAGAVYGGFHYAIDALAGAALGTATCIFALRWAGRDRHAPRDGLRDAPADGPGDAPPDGLRDAPADGPGDALPDGPGDALSDGPGDALPDGPGDALPDGLRDAPADGPGDAPPDGDTL